MSAPTLDNNSYPHIFERVIRFASPEVLMALRCVSRQAQAAADRAMVEHMAYDSYEVREPQWPFRLIPVARDGLDSERMAPFLDNVRCLDFYGDNVCMVVLPPMPHAVLRSIWSHHGIKIPQAAGVIEYLPCTDRFGRFGPLCVRTWDLPPPGAAAVMYALRSPVATESDFIRWAYPSVDNLRSATLVVELKHIEDTLEFMRRHQEARHQGQLLTEHKFIIARAIRRGAATFLACGIPVTIVGLETIPPALLDFAEVVPLSTVKTEVVKRIRQIITMMPAEGIPEVYGGRPDPHLVEHPDQAIANLSLLTLGEWQATAGWRYATKPPIPEDFIGYLPWDHRPAQDPDDPWPVPFYERVLTDSEDEGEGD